MTAIGEGAFSGCSSLESITLTGIDAIGASAFSGCDNLTTITINPASGSAPAAIKGRNNAPRAAGFDEAAFEGVNPNCLIILGEGVAVPATTAGNYLTTRVGEIPDVNEEGGQPPAKAASMSRQATSRCAPATPSRLPTASR